MKTSARKATRMMRRLRVCSRRYGLRRKLAFSLAVAGVAAGVATVVSMSGMPSEGADPNTVLFLLYVDVVLMLLLSALVAHRLGTVWAERRRGRAGSRLSIRLIVMFSLVAVTPAILVAVFAGLFLNFGIESWFSERVRTALEESRAVARAYLYEHRQNIRADAFAVANDLDRNAPKLMRNPRSFNQFLTAQASLRSLPEALVVDSVGRVIARSALSLSLEFDLVPPDAVAVAESGEIAVLTTEKDDRVRAIVKLNRFVDAYLLVGRLVDPQVLDHMVRTEVVVAQYEALEKRREGIQITFVMVFVVVALLLLLAAVWLGLTLAAQLARPISSLIAAAERVSQGDLTARVEPGPATDEIGTLSRAFNRMTRQLEGQQRGLLEANRQLDERRRFTETVLSGVSAGVIGLDGEGRIHLPNRSASELLATDMEAARGEPLATVVPEMAGLLGEIMARPDRPHQGEIRVVRQGRFHTLLVSMAAERVGGDIFGYVVTFDDVTELFSAQRKAAWADVARRIAHEIKNPLTPIQLSAERLKRKYLKEIRTDPDVFIGCTDTIVRQVEDIGRMVDEFSAFARMPQPTMKRENLSEICRQSVFFERNRYPEIEFDVELGDGDASLRCDGRQVAQALANILKNAAESVMRRKTQGDGVAPGLVRVGLAEEDIQDGRRVIVTVEDNGPGFPDEHRDRLTEPYVTTHDKGTGLGLAIVKKIMEDHNGDLVLEDREGGGARVSLIFHPVAEPAGRADQDTGGEGDADPMKVASSLLAQGL